MVTWLLRRILALFWFAITIGVVAIGFTLAGIHTWRMDSPTLHESLPIRQVQGRVAEITVTADGTKFQLESPIIEKLKPEYTPRRLNITFKAYQPEHIVPGDTIRLRAGLYPPPQPVLPGAFDFARHFYFKGVGGVGFGVKPVEKIAAGDAKNSWRQNIAGFRLRLTERIRQAMEPAHGAIAAALITGDAAAIPIEISDTMREAGLTHLLAVSGMNLAIVAGTLFVFARFALVLIPRLSLHIHAKKWAAGVALIGSAAYLVICGSPVSAERAFVMTALVLLAVMLDRVATPMRSLAWAALIVLIVSPYSLLGAGFQLSFAATLALVAFYERYRDPLHKALGARRILYYLLGAFFSSLIAGLATAPFTIYHFSNFSTYGLLANVLVAPLITFWIMPSAVLAVFLMPLGLDGFGFRLMEWGIETMLSIARWVVTLPEAMLQVPPLTTAGLVCVALGGLWLCLWQQRWRWLGGPFIALGMLTMLLYAPPDILVSETGKAIAVRLKDGTLAAITGKRDSFTSKQWLRGIKQEKLTLRREVTAEQLHCDRLGCIYQANGYNIAFPKLRDALNEDCAQNDAVITPLFISRHVCTHPAEVIDGWDIKKNGAYSVWLKKTGIEVKNVRQLQGQRPWGN